MSRPSLLLTGLPWDDPIIVAAGIDPEMIRNGLEALDSELTDAGYDYKSVFASPDDPRSIQAYIDALKSRHWDGVIIGFGVRGNPKLTVYFEMLVNMVVEHSPGTKLLFNSSPDSTLDAAKRQVPI